MGDKGVKILAKLEAKALKRARMVRFALIDTSRSLKYTISALMHNPLYREVQAISIPPSVPFDVSSQIRAQDRGMSLLELYKIDRYLDTSVSVYDEDIDVFFIKGPPKYRFELIETAIKLGRHIILSPTVNSIEFNQLIETKKQYQKNMKRLNIMYQPNRFLQCTKRCKEIIDSKQYGDIRDISMNYESSWGTLPMATERFTWWHRRKYGGGVIGSYGFDCIDILEYLLNDKIESVNANTSRRINELDGRKITSEDMSTIELKFQNGYMGKLVLNALIQQDEDRRRDIIIKFDKHILHLDLVKCNLYLDNELLWHEEVFSSNYTPSYIAGVGSTSYGLTELFDSIVDSMPIRKKQFVPNQYLKESSVNIEDAFGTIKAIDAIRMSSDNNEWVDVKEVPEG